MSIIDQNRWKAINFSKFLAFWQFLWILVKGLLFWNTRTLTFQRNTMKTTRSEKTWKQHWSFSCEFASSHSIQNLVQKQPKGQIHFCQGPNSNYFVFRRFCIFGMSTQKFTQTSQIVVDFEREKRMFWNFLKFPFLWRTSKRILLVWRMSCESFQKRQKRQKRRKSFKVLQWCAFGRWSPFERRSPFKRRNKNFRKIGNSKFQSSAMPRISFERCTFWRHFWARARGV